MTDQEAAAQLRGVVARFKKTIDPSLREAHLAGAEALEVLRAVEIQLDTNATHDTGAVLTAIRWIVKNRVGAR